MSNLLREFLEQWNLGFSCATREYTKVGDTLTVKYLGLTGPDSCHKVTKFLIKKHLRRMGWTTIVITHENDSYSVSAIPKSIQLETEPS